MDPVEYLEDDEDLEDQEERAMDAGGRRSPFYPPTDPPIVPGGKHNAVVPGSHEDQDEELDDVEEDAPPQRRISDDEIVARVRRLLRTDASTSMLRISVTAEDGVVTLQGLVQTLEDTDNAAEVASRVPGVIDVVDELEVED